MDVETDIHLLRSGYLRQNLTGDLHEVQLPLRVFGLAGDPGDRVRKPPVGIAGWQVVGSGESNAWDAASDSPFCNSFRNVSLAFSVPTTC